MPREKSKELTRIETLKMYKAEEKWLKKAAE